MYNLPSSEILILDGYIVSDPGLSILLEMFKTCRISYREGKLVVVHSCPPSEAVLADVQAVFPGMSQHPIVSNNNNKTQDLVSSVKLQ